MKREELRHTNQVLLLVAIVLVALYFGADFLIPLSFAVLFSSLVLPVAKFLERKLHLGRALASFASTLLIFVVTGLLLILLIQQTTVFVKDLAEQKETITAFAEQAQSWLTNLTGYNIKDELDLENQLLGKTVSFFQEPISAFLTNTTGAIAKFLLMLIYVFLLLLYRSRFVKFVRMYTAEDGADELGEIVGKISRVAHHYLWGRIQIMLILAVMYIILFHAYGLEHAWLLVVFGTIITIIPYFGPFISGLLPIIFMVLFGHSSEAVISFSIIIIIVQLIESYVLEPLILGYEVQQNPIFVIIAVILGGTIWGLPGLILFVPLFAILKIIFDHSPPLAPVGYLMGFESKSGERNKSWMHNFLQRFRK
ncbi:MAG: AI-2E family transporter [Flavobacteriales bacterium]|nr:AI-2E family transporter [Flavobacteriales bacterium]